MNFKKYTIRIYIVILAILSTTFCHSQAKEIGIPNIKNYKRNEYKGGTQNWDIDQDKNGNLYFANNSGLLKFDGTTWFKYSLPSNSAIRSLKIDNNSRRIYVGGNNEFGYFHSNDKGELIYHSLSDIYKKYKNFKNINLIWKIHFYQGEVIFQSFTKVFFLKNNILRFYESKNKFQFSFLINNKLYFQDKKIGLIQYSNQKFTPLKGTNSINNSEIWAIFPIENNRLILATLENGLFVYDNNTIRPWETEANNYIKKNSSLGGCMIKNKFLVFNTVLNGIIITDLNGKIIQHLNRQKGIQNNTILKSFVDSKNNLWLGLDNGITFINENSPFTYFDYSYNMSTVYCSIIHKNTLYVATNQGLFYHKWTDSFVDEPFKRVEGTIAQAWNIQLIDDVLLCASNNGALLIENGKVTKVLDHNGYFGFLSIPNHPNYIIGENYNGFSIFKKNNNTVTYENSVAGFDETTNTFETLLDDNFLWLKKSPYLYQMKLSNDLKKFEQVKIHSKISNNYKGIGSIQKINDKIYFQTKNHFFRYSKEQEIFFEDNKISSYFKNIPTVNTVIEDKLGNIWYCYDETLGVLEKKNNNYIKKQAPFSNLSGNLVNNYISINTIDPNNVFIGLTEGLAHYDFKISNSFITKPKAFIESFSFPEDTISYDNLTNANNNYDLSYSSNHVKFTFSSPIYDNSENISYSYKLEPFEDNWTKWSPSTVKEYTNLREGSYTMKVKVKNSYGVESDPTIVNFTISPPWYRHPLAYISYLILAGIGIYIVSNRIKLKIRKNKYYETIEQRRLYLEKESKIRQEQHELEKEIEKLENEKLQIKLLSKDKELVNHTLQVAKKNKILNGIIQKLKDINTSSFDEETKAQFTKLSRSITKEVNTDKSWKDLEKHLKNVHFDFLKKLKEKHPSISPREMDLATYLLMNMSTKEIAEFMNISTGGVELARYRLRKKLGLNQKENLIGYLMSIK